jgi:hypothetical protein
MKKTQKFVLKKSVINWTGTLAKSVKSVPKSKEVRVGGTTNYADFIEAGGRGGFAGNMIMVRRLELGTFGMGMAIG